MLTPRNESAEQPPKKKKKKATRGLLSFGDEEEADISDASTPAPKSPQDSTALSPTARLSPDRGTTPRRLTPNPNAILPAPKVLTKAALQAEALARDNLRREFLALQEIVKATEVMIPFVFYDGTNIPGGTVKIKKGDHIWLFLDKCRKVGAELGVGGTGSGGGSGKRKSKHDSRREWARIGVDDLLCVRGEVIIPHVSLPLSHFSSSHADHPFLALRAILFHCKSGTKSNQVRYSFIRLLKFCAKNLICRGRIFATDLQ